MSDNFSDFTKLVLSRMETNPEEFFSINSGYSRWQGLVRGLEAMARGDTDSREYHVLWPLTDEERSAILAAYRELYLSELHRDMLRNIVSGEDKQQIYPQTIAYSNDINPLKGGVLRGSTNSVITASSMAMQAKSVMDTEFDRAYAKVEGAQVPVKSKLQRFILNPTQVATAQKLGIPIEEYAKHAARLEARLEQ